MADFLWKGSPNFGYPRGAGGQNHPTAIVWHITAGGSLPGLDSWFGNPDAGASAHLGIEEAEVHQYVRFEDAAWHAGIKRDPDLSNPHVARWWRDGANPNLFTIGVEVVSAAGPNDVARGEHRVSSRTWRTMVEVCKELHRRLPQIDASESRHLGHYQIDAVTRSRDPKSIYWPQDIWRAHSGEDDMLYLVMEQGSPYVWITNGMSRSYLRDMEHADALGIARDIRIVPQGTLKSVARLDT